MSGLVQGGWGGGLANSHIMIRGVLFVEASEAASYSLYLDEKTSIKIKQKRNDNRYEQQIDNTLMYSI